MTFADRETFDQWLNRPAGRGGRDQRSLLFGDMRALETEHHFTFDPREPRVKLSHKLGLFIKIAVA
jgi:hypothetical protein